MSTGGLRIVVVDDERAIRRYLRVSLGSYGHTVFEAATGQAAVAAVSAHRPDLVLLDLGLPDLSGIEVTRLLREWTHIPILIIAVSGQESDKVAALDAGADDYITKPFGLAELMARIRAAIRHTGPSTTEPVLATGELVIDLSRRMVHVAGREVQLTPTEYDLLRTLATHAGKVLTHRQLLREVWDTEHEQKVHMLQVNVSNLRSKIESNPMRPRYVVTVPGVGYRLATEA